MPINTSLQKLYLLQVSPKHRVMPQECGILLSVVPVERQDINWSLKACGPNRLIRKAFQVAEVCFISGNRCPLTLSVRWTKIYTNSADQDETACEKDVSPKSRTEWQPV